MDDNCANTYLLGCLTFERVKHLEHEEDLLVIAATKSDFAET